MSQGTAHHSHEQQAHGGDEREQREKNEEQNREGQQRYAGQSRGRGTRTVVLVAMGVNALIALAKFGAGFIAGSSSLLAEGAHSVADTFNEVFLLVSIWLSNNPPDRDHPFGHGKERFLWSFVAAIFIFVAGGLFAIIEGAFKIMNAGSNGSESFLIGYLVLGVALIAEAISWTVTIREVRKSACEQERGFFEEVRQSRNTTVKLPLYEDTAALIGIAVAAGGLALTQVTGDKVYDGIGSIVIGFILITLAWKIGSNSRDLLLGVGLTERDKERVHQVIAQTPEVQRMVRFFSMFIGPHSALVTADLDLQPGIAPDQVDDIIDRLDHKIRAAVPEVLETFLEPHVIPDKRSYDPTQSPSHT